MNAKADGTWGYSNPNDEHMIFCVDPEYYTMFRAQFASLIVAEGTGIWEDEVEPCFAMRADVFRRIWRNHPYLFAKQKAFMELGYLKARNWRTARIIINAEPMITEVLGTWLEVTESVAKAQAGWSMFNNRWYTVMNNPPDCIEEENEREETQIIYDLRAMLYYLANEINHYPRGYADIMRRSFDILPGRTLENGVRIDKQSVYAMIGNAHQQSIKANKDNPFVWYSDACTQQQEPVMAFHIDCDFPEQIINVVSNAVGENPEWLKPQSQANRGWS